MCGDCCFALCRCSFVLVGGQEARLNAVSEREGPPAHPTPCALLGDSQLRPSARGQGVQRPNTAVAAQGEGVQLPSTVCGVWRSHLCCICTTPDELHGHVHDAQTLTDLSALAEVGSRLACSRLASMKHG